MGENKKKKGKKRKEKEEKEERKRRKKKKKKKKKKKVQKKEEKKRKRRKKKKKSSDQDCTKSKPTVCTKYLTNKKNKNEEQGMFARTWTILQSYTLIRQLITYLIT